MTEMESQTTLKNIVDGWRKKNEAEILDGTKIKSPLELLKYERVLLLILIELGRSIIELVLKTMVENRNFQKRTARTFRREHSDYRHLSNRTVRVRTLFGNLVSLKCRLFVLKPGNRQSKAGKNGSASYPALEALGIRHHTTPALASEVARNVTEGPSLKAAQDRLARYGIILDIKVIKRISEYFAQVGLSVRNAWLRTGGEALCQLLPKEETLAGKRVVIGTDGGRLRTRETKLGRLAIGKKRHGYKTDWREPKVLVIRTFDKEGKVVRNELPVYDATLGNADALFELLHAHLRARHIENALEIVCVCDGAPWIWERMKPMLMGLGVDPSKVTEVLDFYHALEHITAVADGRKMWSRKKRSRWLNGMRHLLIDGNIDAVLLGFRKLARGRAASKVKTEIRYFEENRERMHYNLLAEKKLPIGSGATESAVRQIVNMRLKGAGMFWKIENAEAFLHLRCYMKARRWDSMEKAVFSNAI
jgi:hypothetical protein